MRLLCLGAGLLMLSGCDRPKPMPEEENAVTAFALQRFMDSEAIAGAVTMVVGPDGPVAVEAFGLADIAGQRPMRKDGMFRIGGLTRSMTHVAVMMLVEEGKIGLDDPVDRFVPAFKQTVLRTADGRVTTPDRRVTVRHLLEQTSGIDPAPLAHPGAPVDTLTLAAMADAYAGRPLRHEPGARQIDNDNDVHLLGRLIEVASGQSYGDFMQQRLFDPLGMDDTTFWPNPDQLDQLAKTYVKDRESGGLTEAKGQRFTLPLHDDRRTALPADGLYSCARDLARFHQMLLNQGEADGRRYLKPSTLRQMTAPRPGDGTATQIAGVRTALGFQVVTEASSSLRVGTYGYAGNDGIQAWIDPTKRRSYILLFQRADLTSAECGDIGGEFQKAVAEAYGK